MLKKYKKSPAKQWNLHELKFKLKWNGLISFRNVNKNEKNDKWKFQHDEMD